MSLTLQDLLPWLVFLCLVEGLAFLGPLQVAFVSYLGERYSMKGSGLRLLGVLPSTRGYVSHRIPIGVTSAGVYVLTDRHPTEAALYERESFQFFPYDELSGVASDDATIYWDRKTRTRLPSARFASIVVDGIRELSDLGEDQRSAKIDSSYSKSFDLDDLGRLRDAIEGSLGWLSSMCGAVFVLLLFFLPLTVAAGWVNTRTLMLWLGLLLIADVAVAVTGYRFALVLRGQGLDGDFTPLFWYLLYPPAAIHAAGKMTREIYRDYDYLTVAASSLSRERLLSGFRAELYGVDLALKSSTDEPWIEYWNRRRHAILTLLQQADVSESEALSPPARKDPVAARFCPVCEMEYIDRAKICTECQFDLIALGPR